MAQGVGVIIGVATAYLVVFLLGSLVAVVAIGAVAGLIKLIWGLM